MLTIIFIASLVLIIAMIALKSIEEKRQVQFFFPRLRVRSDIFANKLIEDVKVFFAILSKKNAKLFVLFLVGLIFSALSNLKRKSNIKKMRILNSLKSERKIDKKKGPPSFFLKNVSEYKNIR